MKRPCLACGAPVAGAPRHRRCAPAPYGAAWQRMSRAQIAREPQCRICGHRGSRSNPLTADHVLPLAAGGRSEFSNLQTLCRAHNSAKGARTFVPDETGRPIRQPEKR